MKYYSIIFVLIVGFISTVRTDARPTPAEFQKIANMPGDNVPLLPELTAAGPLWAKSEVLVSCNFADGRSTKEQLPVTTKTVGGRYIVYSFPSEIYGRQMNTIATFDEKEKTIKTWSCYGDVVVEGTEISDSAKRIYSGFSQYSSEGGQFIEICVGSYSESEVSDHTVVLKDGKFFMTRDTKTTPRK